ncbi:MAG TPA: class I SAM-dependent methyltransferase [Pseudogracilibacillus sp.]|nr:class I SAM-dependent methyltransferase [Pseudogracilibacillus sp.]
MLKGIIPFAHQLLDEHIGEGDIVIDATCGNGHDTVYLSKQVAHKGRVYAFDVQTEAIENSKKRSQNEGLTNIEYIQDSHARVKTYIKEQDVGQVAAAIFNLGYLPGSDKTIVTKATSTIEAVKQISDLLKKNGLIILVVYHGHTAGKLEKDELLQYVTQLDQADFSVLQYQFINQVNHPPFIIAIQKR